MSETELENLAGAAYTLFRTKYRNEPEWSAYPNKHIWRDLVTTWERYPDAEPANVQEECVKAAYTAWLKPVVVSAPKKTEVISVKSEHKKEE